MSIINIYSSTLNLQRQMAHVQTTNIASDYKKVKASKNTDWAYECKVKKFLQYCDTLHCDDVNPCLVTVEKVFLFLYYCAYRKKKNTKLKKNVLCNGHVVRFHLEEYFPVVNAVHDGLSENEHVIAFSQWNQYLCAIKRHILQQNGLGVTNINHDDLYTEKLKQLIHIVTYRGEMVNRATFKERNDGAFQPYKLSNEINNIEQFMWDDSPTSGMFYGAASLRDRFHFLFTIGAVIRSQSVFKADLSDLMDFNYTQKNEPDPYHVLIMRIGFGKTIKGDNPLYARGIRHRDPRLCHIGALGLWLMARFRIFNEMENIDFSNGRTWFNIKLMISTHDKDVQSCKFFK